MIKKLAEQAAELSFGANKTSPRDSHYNFVKDFKKFLISDEWVLTAGWITLSDVLLHSTNKCGLSFIEKPSSFYTLNFRSNGTIEMKKSLIRDFANKPKIILDEGFWNLKESECNLYLEFKMKGYLPNYSNVVLKKVLILNRFMK